jgi:autophagy-related protein 17
MSPTSSAHGARSQTSSSANSQLQTSNQALRSQTDGADEPDDIPIEALVQHLLAAKRSLNSISLVWRANELVTSARTSLEQSLILSSRTTFLRRGITDQVKLLRRVRSGVGHVYKEGLREFEDVIRSLDEADIRLQQTMDVLRETMVERKFRPEGEEERSLLDFVDEQGVEGIRRGLREGIDQSQVGTHHMLV